MLKSLQISNYALIDSLTMEFDKGLTILSGETGAGKSIILGALDLVTGKRADTTVLLDKSGKCIVEAEFAVSGYRLRDFFAEHDLDYENPATIRREISPAGKSRAFINDTPVNLPVLQDLGSRLIDIHSQHEHILLASNPFQLSILDAFAGNSELLERYRATYQLYTEKSRALEELKVQASRSAADLDYFTFQYEELKEMNPVPGELAELEREQEMLSHAGEISTALYGAWQALSEEEMSAVHKIKSSIQGLNRIVRFFPEAEDYIRRLESNLLDIEDLALELNRRGQDVEYDPARLEAVRKRINQFYHLLEKHHLKNEQELIDLTTDLEQRISKITSFDEELKKLEREKETVYQELKELGRELSGKRRKVIPEMEQEITGMLRKLGMADGRFKVEQTEMQKPGPYGYDDVGFLFSANAQVPVQDVRKVASGGELSRLMLSLKSLLTTSSGLPTIIFDEIDAGVSGEVAERVGEIIEKMGEGMQVINITHLPQIASKGKSHYYVFKTTENGKTHTRIRKLKPEERIEEIARLLSGRERSEAAIRNARELLGIK